MKIHKKCGSSGWRARLGALCCACLSLLLLNLPQVGYSAAIMVKQAINLNGNNTTVDSYDSSDPTKSENGQWSASVSGNSGDVICIDGISNSAPVGSINIYGRAFVAPESGVAYGPEGFIGTHAWAAATTNIGAEPGYLVPNTNFVFPTITLPDYSGFLGPVISGGTVVTTNSQFPYSPPAAPYISTNYYDNVICGNYFTTNPLGNAVVTCPSVLVLPQGYSIANLTIASGASLTVYVGGTSSVTIAANQFVNLSALPSDFVMYCTSDVTSLSFSGNAQFIGVLIAPTANATFDGSGNNSVDISGAIMANSIILNGHFDFHFDEALIQEGIVPPSPSLAASLAAPSMSGSGQFQFNVSGVPGFSYAIETSTDLTDWLPIFTNTSPFTFTDTNATPPAQNFYRAVYYQQ